jgi:hypothetical protein
MYYFNRDIRKNPTLAVVRLIKTHGDRQEFLFVTRPRQYFFRIFTEV